MAHRYGHRLVGAEDALDGSKRSLVLDIVADPTACGTRGARAVGVASACGDTLGAARRTPPRTCARVRRCRGVWEGRRCTHC
eukprot:scaffold1836_cov56-Phaeocystis_antarctica.AAC.3